MLDKKVFVEGIKKLIVFFPQWGIKTEDSEVMGSWYEALSYCNDESFKKMIKDYIDKEKFSPTIFALKEHYTGITNKKEIYPEGFKPDWEG